MGRPAAVRGRGNAQRSDTGWVTDRNRFPGRVVGRQSVVGMALTIIMIRWSTDEGGTQTRVASARVGVLPQVGDGKNEPTRCRMATGQNHCGAVLEYLPMSALVREDLFWRFGKTDDPEIEARRQHILDLLLAASPRRSSSSSTRGCWKVGSPRRGRAGHASRAAAVTRRRGRRRSGRSARAGRARTSGRSRSRTTRCSGGPLRRGSRRA